MRGRGKVTPKVRARILALRAEKKSQREIVAVLGEEGLKISQPTVLAVLAKAKGGQGAGAGTKGAKGARTAGKEPGKAKGGAKGGDGGANGAANAEGAAQEPPAPKIPNRTDMLRAIHKVLERPLPELGEEASEDLRGAHESLVVLRATIYVELESGDYSLAQISKALEQLAAARALVRKFSPPEAPDPKKDPMNLAARAAIHDYAERAIEGIEARIGARWRQRISG